MLRQFAHLLFAGSLFLAAVFAQPVQAAGAQSAPGASGPSAQLTSPVGLLNSDGTLKLDGHFSGSLDLKGWNVSIDPQRGPTFSPDAQPQAVTTASPAFGHWGDVGGGGGGALNDFVSSIAVIGSDVYVGGGFTDADNIPAADYIAKWDGSNWSALSSNGSGDGSLDAQVKALAVIGTDLYVGGSFGFVSDNGTDVQSARYIAKWDGSHWSGLGGNGSGGGSLSSDVLSIAASGSDLYVGGSFTNVNNNGTVLTAADYVAKWDGTNWSALGSNGASDGSLNFWVDAVAASGSNVYVGGYFTNVNNNGTVLTAADYVAKWDGSNWSALSSNGASNGSLNNVVYALAVSGTDLYVGGIFSNVHDGLTALSEAHYLARWDGSNWSAVGNGGAGVASLNGSVQALFVNGTDLYVGGYFSDVKNGATTLSAADCIVKWDGSNWSALGSNGAGDGSIFNNGVDAIAVGGSTVYTGGYFLGINNNGTVLNQAQNIGQWNGSNWSAVGGVQGSLNHQVLAVAISGTDVYVGGYFTNLSNHGVALPAADYIAKWDGANWSALGSNGQGDGSLNWFVDAIAVSGSNVYAGGWFATVYNSDGNYVPTAGYVANGTGATGPGWAAMAPGAGHSTTG